MPFTNTLTRSRDRISDAGELAQRRIHDSRAGAASLLESASRRIRGTSKAASKTIAKRGGQAADTLEGASTRVRPEKRANYAQRHTLQMLFAFSLLALVIGLLAAQRAANHPNDFDDEDDLF